MRLCPLAANGTAHTKMEAGPKCLNITILAPFHVRSSPSLALASPPIPPELPHALHRCPHPHARPPVASTLKAKGHPRYSVEPLTDRVDGIYKHGAHFMTPMPGHFDYDLRACGNGPGVDYLTIDAEETISVLKRMKIRSHHCHRSANQQLTSTEYPRFPSSLNVIGPSRI